MCSAPQLPVTNPELDYLSKRYQVVFSLWAQLVFIDFFLCNTTVKISNLRKWPFSFLSSWVSFHQGYQLAKLERHSHAVQCIRQCLYFCFFSLSVMEAIREPQLNPSDSRQKSPVRKSSFAAVSRRDLLRFVMALMPLRKSSPQSWDRKLVCHLMQVEHLWHGQQRKRTESRLHKQWTARYTVQSTLWRRNFKPRLKVQISENSSEKFVEIVLVYNKISWLWIIQWLQVLLLDGCLCKRVLLVYCL